MPSTLWNSVSQRHISVVTRAHMSAAVYASANEIRCCTNKSSALRHSCFSGNWIPGKEIVSRSIASNPSRHAIGALKSEYGFEDDEGRGYHFPFSPFNLHKKPSRRLRHLWITAGEIAQENMGIQERQRLQVTFLDLVHPPRLPQRHLALLSKSVTYLIQPPRQSDGQHEIEREVCAHLPGLIRSARSPLALCLVPP